MSAPLADDNWRQARITDEGLAHMRSRIGIKRTLPPWNSTVTKDAIWHFALGVGDDNPLWWDEDHASRSPWGRLIAPPYYVISHSTGPLTKPEHGQMSTAAYLPGVMGMYVGNRWDWRRPVHVGETIAATAELHEVRLREDGRFGRTVDQVEKIVLSTDAGEVVAEVYYTLKRLERRETTARGGYMDRPLAHYTAEDRAALDRHYDDEVAQLRRGADPRFVEGVAIGDLLGPMLKGPLTVTNIIGFRLGYGSQLAATNRLHHEQLKLHPSTKVIHPVNGVADQYGAVHWDADLARAGGMPAPYDNGPQRFAWFTHLLTDWAGDHGFLTSLDVRYKAPNFLGDITWLTGEVTDVDLAERLVTITLKAANQLEQTHSVATAKVRLPSRLQANAPLA